MNDYKARHAAAMSDPKPGFEHALVCLMHGLSEYADAHRRAYESAIGDDGVLGEHWRDIVASVVGLLNGEAGRLDCGTLDGQLRRLAEDNGAPLPE